MYLQIGKAKVVRESTSDQVLVIGACVTLAEALKAAEKLSSSGINIRVMDLFTLKPIDKDGIIKHARECGGRIVTVEDHYPEGIVAASLPISFFNKNWYSKVAFHRWPG